MLKTATKQKRRGQAAVSVASPINGISSEDRPAPLAASLGLGLAGSVLLWAGFPPINLPWLAWIAPVPWLWMVVGPRLAGWRPYVALWLAGFVHWLLMLE